MLLGIRKRGDRYLRTLLIHGARTTVRYVKRRRDLRSRWVARLSESWGCQFESRRRRHTGSQLPDDNGMQKQNGETPDPSQLERRQREI
jgi:hypothetical protein